MGRAAGGAIRYRAANAGLGRARIAASRAAVRLAGVLLDLGVSSPQLDEAARGFSVKGRKADGPLDLRMNPNQGIQTLESEPRNPYPGIQTKESKSMNTSQGIQTQESKSLNPNSGIQMH